jgi:hypothetical protein
MQLRHRGLRWIAGVAAFGIAACARAPEQKEAAKPTQQPVEADAKPAVLTENTLDREGMIIAALHAMTAAALGQEDVNAQSELKGRKFEVRMRFGCPGLANATRSLAYDDKEQVLRAKVTSDLTDQPLPVSDLLYRKYEGAVGFVLGQPWLLSAGCPRSDFAGMASGQPTIVLAQLFTADESRAQRPGSSYELTKPMKPAEVPRQGLDLLVSGRLAELADGRAVHCGVHDGAPACLVAGKIDRVAILRAGSDDVLGEWGQGLGPAR